MNKTSSNLSSRFRVEYYLFIWLSALISIIFSLVNLIRYFRRHSHRTHLTYIYHFSLGFSLISSLISTPLQTLIDSNSSLDRPLSCNFYLISLFLSSSGVGYSIAYASIEQTFFIFFSQNLRLTWMREFSPFLIIFSFCCLIGTLIVLLLKYSWQISCYFGSIRYQSIWFVFQFIIPFVLMFIAMIFLIYRIEIHTNRLRISFNRKRSRQKFQRILIHLNIYHLFYFLAICPMNIYSFIRIAFNLEQPLVEILLMNYLFISLHCYPILVYCLTNIKQQQQQQRRVVFHREQRQTPFVIILPRHSFDEDEYQRTRL